jgi:hypothetical protein
VVGLILSFIIAAAIKFFERALTFRQAFLMSAVTCAVTLVLLTAYYAAKPQLLGMERGAPALTDALAPLVAMFLTASLITRLSASYGIKNVGWFDLGAKVVFGLVVLSWIFAAAMFLLIYLVHLGGQWSMLRLNEIKEMFNMKSRLWVLVGLSLKWAASAAGRWRVIGGRVPDRGWKRPYDDPIPVPCGRELVTLEDAGDYITKLAKAEREAPEWQTAAGALLLVADAAGRRCWRGSASCAH